MLKRHLLFWSGAAVVFCLVLWLLGSVLLPFVAGLALAYLLDPLVSRLERVGLSRLLAVILIALVVTLVVVAALLLVVPILVREAIDFLARLPEIVSQLQTLLTDRVYPRLEKLGVDVSRLRPSGNTFGDVARQAAGWAGALIAGLWSGGQAVVGVLSLLVVTPIVAFFVLLDWPAMIARIDSWLPRRHAPTIRRLAREMDRSIAGFLRGQALVCLLLGSFYAIALSLTGLNFGFLIGLMSGLIGFIPFVGTMVGFVTATAVALAQFWPEWTMIGIVIAIFLFGQFVEGNFLQPKLVGNAVGLHPVWLMFALFAFGALAGFVGLLVAVPVAAAIGVLARHGLSLYLASDYYGAPAEISAAPDAESPAEMQADRAGPT